MSDVPQRQLGSESDTLYLIVYPLAEGFSGFPSETTSDHVLVLLQIFPKGQVKSRTGIA